MEDIKKPIPYNDNDKLIQGAYYISNCGMCFSFDEIGNSIKPFLLDNGLRIDHVPIEKDKGLLNLKNMSDRPKEEQKAIASKGGTNSAIVQAKRRTFKESLELFMSLGISSEQLRKIDSSIIDRIPVDLQKTLTQGDLISLKQLELSQDGSDKASVFVRDTIGEKPTDKHEIEADIITDNDRQLIEKISKRLQSGL